MKRRFLFLTAILCIVFYGCEKDDTNDLELSQSSFNNVSSEGETLEVDITSNSEWQISKTAQWCTVTPNKGSGNQKLSIQIEANLGSKERKVTITVTPSNGTSKKIEITQEAGYTTIEQYHYQLPVIFHVFYKDKSDPEQYVSANRLAAIMNEVNRKYKDIAHSIDMNLSLTLATTDAKGNTLSTPGVEYIQWPESYPIDCDLFMNDNINKGGKGYVKYLWEPNNYINVMVYNFTQDKASAGTTLGISHLPFTSKGKNSLAGTNITDNSYLELENLPFPYCVSINSLFIDEQSTATNYNTFDVTVTLAHELGHYLGLHHVFSEAEDSKSCEDTDYCEDTPSYNIEAYNADCEYIYKNDRANYTFKNLVKRSNCNDEEFTSYNIMDYSISYSDQFTPNQRTRVRHILMYGLLIPGPKKDQASTRSVHDGVLDLPIRTLR